MRRKAVSEAAGCAERGAVQARAPRAPALQAAPRAGAGAQFTGSGCFTCFTSNQFCLRAPALQAAPRDGAGAQFTGFPRTQAQMLTLNPLARRSKRRRSGCTCRRRRQR